MKKSIKKISNSNKNDNIKSCPSTGVAYNCHIPDLVYLIMKKMGELF